MLKQVIAINNINEYKKNKHKTKVMHTYCNVDSKARKFPSFPADQRLTSASKASANLWKTEDPTKF